MIDLKNIKNKELVKLICGITPYVASIMKDEKIMQAWHDKYNVEDVKNFRKEGLTDRDIKVKASIKSAENIEKLIPLLLEEHANDIYSLLAVINECSVEEMEEANPFETIKQLKDLLNIEGIKDFF